MPAQIRFFNKNRIDLSVDNVTIAITDAVATNTGQDFVDFMRNRNNTSAWLTTGSTDAANTEILIDTTDVVPVSDIILVGINFKAYTIQYFDGAVFTDFSTAISETVNAKTTIKHSFTEVNTSQIKIIVTAAFVVDADKQAKQIIITDTVATGQLAGWPEIRKPRHSTNKKINSMLSGKVNVIESVGAFSVDLRVKVWTSSPDLDIIEEIYSGKRGVLLWINAGDDAQFLRTHIGYRSEDIFFMRAVNDYMPELQDGVYQNGAKITMKLREAIN